MSVRNPSKTGMNERTCFLSSFRRAISAAFSSFDIPAMPCAVEAGAASAFPLSDGVMERAIDAGRGLASGDTARGAIERRGCGATGDVGAGADHGSNTVGEHAVGMTAFNAMYRTW